MALKDITTIEETEQLSADATFYTADGGAFRRAGMDAVKDALGLALESTATKEALLNCFRHVAWIDENGQDYYDALYDALYNVPVSISATFVQGSNVIYNTDPLSVLRQYLVVRATYEDETVQTVTAYTLSGNLYVGTSTITVAYKGKSTTFEVEVTQAESYITAVYTPGTDTIYTDDSLDVLKDNLVVTYYARQGAEGVIVPASDYILSGTLTAGTSTVMVNYLGNTTTFTVTGVVDYYNKWTWSLADGDFELAMNATLDYYTNETNVRYTYRSPWENRRCSVTGKGLLPYRTWGTTDTPSQYYPIPIPQNANKVTISITPNTQFIYTQVVHIANGNVDRLTSVGWAEGTTQATFEAGENNALFFNTKYDSAGTSYPTEPTEVTVTFSVEA